MPIDQIDLTNSEKIHQPPLFLFDLDATITRKPILPTIAAAVGKSAQMQEIVDRAVEGTISFKQSFVERIELLKEIPIHTLSEIVRHIPLNMQLVSFIAAHKDRCYIITGNIDALIGDLMQDIGMEDRFFSSKACVEDHHIKYVIDMLDKKSIIEQFTVPFAAVGDGRNDAAMLEQAVVGIGYGGVRSIDPAVLACADYLVYEETDLCRLLKQL
ncbi:MAG: HAD-IB family phosphatase [Lachnospiraceae bacterium]